MFVLASQKGLVSLGFFGGPLETRTPDPLIKSNEPQHTSLPDPHAIPTKSKQTG